MPERTKTLVAIGIAVAVSAIAAVTRPNRGDFDGDQHDGQVNKPLVEFDDPDKAASLEIVRVDSDSGDLERFKVARDVKGSWSIPSHANYPADAKAQVRNVATLFIGKLILGVAAMSAEKHETFGVKEPSAENAGEDGVGTLVRIEDAGGDELVALIVGKPEKHDPTQRFVRRVGQDVVLVAKLDSSSLSTDFEDWIDKDILQLKVFDIQDIQIRDYTIVQVENTNRLVKRSAVDLGWDPVRGDWSLKRLVTFNAAGMEVDATLTPEEELNRRKLNLLKNALTSLEIVDVRPKPAGMGSDLQTEAARVELEQSLNALGFRTPPTSLNASSRLLADNGEVIITMKDGVRYVLKFGATVAKKISELKELNRTLLVTAELDDSKNPMPPEPNYPEAKEGDDVDAIAAKREQMRRAYQLKLDDRDEQLAGARRRVFELNDRFAGWYYVVSDDLYQQILLSRSDVVQEKKATAVLSNE
jgi:hypothetical protein